MNSNLNQLYSLVLIVLMSCGNSTGEKKTTEQPVAAIASVSEKPPPRVAEESSALATTSAASPNNNDLVGTWKLRLEVFDDNSNCIPDEEEMKKGYSNNYLLQFNADGSCRIQQFYSGKYELTTEDGRPMLKVYRKRIEKEEDEDPPPDIYQITSVGKDELVLLSILLGDPTSFWFFKRIK